MPAYGVVSPPTALYAGDTGLAFNAERPLTNSTSQQFAFASTGNNPVLVSIEAQFAGAPGAFEFDVMEADVDTPVDYNTVPGGNITIVNSTNVARVDLNPFFGHFLAVFTKIQSANAVNATVRVTRKT